MASASLVFLARFDVFCDHCCQNDTRENGIYLSYNELNELDFGFVVLVCQSVLKLPGTFLVSILGFNFLGLLKHFFVILFFFDICESIVNISRW